jgi:hypothetical protein
MMLQLEQVRSNLEVGLAEAFSPAVAKVMAQGFVTAVVGRRREIEAAALPPSRAG